MRKRATRKFCNSLKNRRTIHITIIQYNTLQSVATVNVMPEVISLNKRLILYSSDKRSNANKAGTDARDLRRSQAEADVQRNIQAEDAVGPV